MADPLSVAGLAAGLVSLGLQVCGGITQYMDALDCREQDVASVRQQNVSLQKTLLVVETSLAQLQPDHQTAAAAVSSCIDGCRNELEALVSLMADLVGSSQPTAVGRRDKLRNQGKKLLYPFSRPKLEQLETTLRNANATLQLALQALGLSVSQLSGEKLAVLESTSHSISASLLVVQSDVSAMSAPLHGINSALSGIHTRFDNLEHVVTQLLVDSPTVSRRSRKITSKPTASQNPRNSKARGPEEACDNTKVQMSGTSSQLIPTAPGGDHFQTLVSLFLGDTGACICRLSRVLKRSDFFWGPLGFYQETAAQEHLPGCPVSQMVGTDRSQRFGFRYTGFQHLIDSAVQLSLTIHSGAGGWAMSPHLTYYPTVDQKTAPAFRTLTLLRDSIDKLVPMQGPPRSVPQWEKLVALALTKILKSFQAGKASPLAVDSNNQSLAHFAAQCIHATFARSRSDLTQPLIELLKYLIKHKVPSNGYSLSGSTPLGTMISRYYDSTEPHVDASLLILQSNSEVTPTYLSCAPTPQYSVAPRRDELWFDRGPTYKVARFLGCSSQIAEAYGCGPLSLAVLANDSAQVEYLLKHHPTALGERNQLGQSPLHLAVEKLACLRLLVRASDDQLLNEADYAGATAVETAILLSGSLCKEGNRRRRCRRCHCAEPLGLFLQADCALPLVSPLQSLLSEASHRCRVKYTRAIRNRRERLKQLALTTLPSTEAERLGLSGKDVLDAHAEEVTQLLGRRGLRVPDALHVSSLTTVIQHRLLGFPPLRSVYAALREPTDADLFFQLGFHDVQLCWEDYARPSYLLRLRLPYWVSLGNHGADVLAHQLKSFETGRGKILSAHFTFWSIGEQTAAITSPHSRDFMGPTILNLTEGAKSAQVLDTADSCQCECSSGGCTPLLYLLKAIINFPHWTPTFEAPAMAEIFVRYLACAGGVLEPRHHRVALRFLTFEALQMRHTCCTPEDGAEHYFRRCPPRDVKEEADEEPGYDLVVLEELLEEFEREVAGILKDQDLGIDLLVEFWEQTWVNRVTEARDRLEGDQLSDDERRRAEEIGVVWDRPVREVTGNPFDEGTEDYWFYELDKIEVE